MAELGCRVAIQLSSGCVSTMSLDQKSFSEYGAHSCSPSMNTWKASVGLLASERSSPLSRLCHFRPLFLFLMWSLTFLRSHPPPASHFNLLLFFGHMPLPLCSLNSLCSLLYNSLSSTLLFLLLALSSLHHYSRHFSPLC